MTKVAIHQPNFLPWLGYFYKIHLCDVFIILDDVQFVKRSYINRSTFCSTEKKAHLVSIPIRHHSQNTKINEISINHAHGTHKIFHTLNRFYGKYPEKAHLTEIDFYLKEINNYNSLSQLNINLIKVIINNIFTNKKILLSSEFSLESTGEERIIELVKIIQGTEYLSGSGARVYQDQKNFERKNIKLTYVDYPELLYRKTARKMSDGFSIYDFIACEGMKNPFLK